MTDDLIKRLCEVAIEKQSEAWGRGGGEQDCSISAILAEEWADRIEKLKAELAGGSFYQEKDIDALQLNI